MDAFQYRISWPRRSTPSAVQPGTAPWHAEKRYKIYNTQRHRHEKWVKLLAAGFEKKDIELSIRTVQYGEWR